MEKTTKTSLKQRTIKRILPTLIVAFTIPFVVCLCIPFEFFANNIDEFFFSFSAFFPIGTLFALLFTAVFFFGLVFLPEKAYRITCAVIISLAFMFFLQGNYLNLGLNSLAGDNLGVASITLGQKILNVFIWIVVIAGGIVLSILKDKNGIIALVGLLVSGIVMITHVMGPLSLIFTTEKVFADREERVQISENAVIPQILTNEGLTTISSSKNVFLFCVDRFDLEYAYLGFDECPEVYSMLEGFTLFEDHTTLYGHTFPGVANMLTGKPYDATKSREDFLNTVYLENDTLDVLDKKGYKVNLFTQPYYVYTDASYLPSYVQNKADATTYEVEHKGLLSLSLMQVSLYRCFPLFVKPYVGNINSGTCNSYVESKGSDGYAQFTCDMKDVWNVMESSTFTSIDDKLFTFLHIDGCHGVLYDEEWNDASLSETNDMTISLKHSFNIINKYIKAMKDAGVYDDATIIITGDHGTPIDDREPLEKQTLTALFVKPAGSTHKEIKRSKAQVSHDDLWPTIFHSENIKVDSNKKSVFQIGEGEKRERKYFWHTYSVPTMQYVYSINGDGTDFENSWKLIETKSYDKFIMD